VAWAERVSSALGEQRHTVSAPPLRVAAHARAGERPPGKIKLGDGMRVRVDAEHAVEIERLAVPPPENTHSIEIDKFVPEEEIDKRYYERPYYIVPDSKSGEEAFGVLHVEGARA
jgi:hypothetical protein